MSGSLNKRKVFWKDRRAKANVVEPCRKTGTRMRSKRSKDRCADTEESLAWVSFGQELTIDMSDEVLGRFRKKNFWTILTGRSWPGGATRRSGRKRAKLSAMKEQSAWLPFFTEFDRVREAGCERGRKLRARWS